MSYHNSKNQEGGYIALITAIIITVIVTLVSFVASNMSFLGRFDTQFFESKDQSRYLAYSCLDHAKLKSAIGYYAGNETITVGSYTCDILPVQTSGSNRIVQTKGTVNNVTTNLEMTMVSSTLVTTQIIEKTNF